MMGININVLQFLLHAKDLGVQFDHTIAIGRQMMSIEEGALDALRSLRDLPALRWPPADTGAQPAVTARCYFEPLMAQWFGARSADAIDASPYEGARLLHDMNLPLPETGDLAAARGAYDAVLDFGCLEHVFDFPCAWRNVAAPCRTGGHVLHVLPTNNLSGHGFYQFSPELFFSLYTADRGFELRIVLRDAS